MKESNNDTMLTGFSGREADASCRRMTLFVLLVGSILMTSSVALADDTTTETCANGAGIVITGVVTGHKYCKSNGVMNWWNAIAWCDAQNRRLFALDDCGCDVSTNCSRLCPDLNVSGRDDRVWTATPLESSRAYYVHVAGDGGWINDTHVYNGNRSYAGFYALCY